MPGWLRWAGGKVRAGFRVSGSGFGIRGLKCTRVEHKLLLASPFCILALDFEPDFFSHGNMFNLNHLVACPHVGLRPFHQM